MRAGIVFGVRFRKLYEVADRWPENIGQSKCCSSGFRVDYELSGTRETTRNLIDTLRDQAKIKIATVEGEMKRIPRILLTCFTLLPLCMMAACAKPDVAKINLINDLGRPAKLDLCKDDVHCDAISDLWTPTKLNAMETHTFVVSNEEMTVFKISTVVDGKSEERCLRVTVNRALKADHNNVHLSSATGC